VATYLGDCCRRRTGVELLASHNLDGNNSSGGSDHNDTTTCNVNATGYINAACDGTCSAVEKARQQWRVFYPQDPGHALRECFAPSSPGAGVILVGGGFLRACSMSCADIKANMKLK
jgi:hypothetical protein